MGKRVSILVLFFYCCFGELYAQDASPKLVEGNRVILNSGNISDVSYYVYSPPYKAMAVYTDIKQVTNNYPEELMSSILSARNQDWVNLNTLGGEEKAEKLTNEEFREAENINKNITYFELLSKFEFTSNNSQMAMIKFYFYKDGLKKPVAGVTIMQQEDGKWKRTSAPYLTNMSMVLLVFKADVLERVLRNQPANEIEKKVISEVYNGGNVDIEKVLQLDLNEREKEVLTNPLNW